MVDLVGPLGRGFGFPKRRAHCLLVGGGIGAAPLFFLADELRNEGHRVDVILGARSAGHLLSHIEARRLASICRITTEDGTQGETGRVTDILEETIDRCESEVVYTCGPHPMLAAVSGICSARRLPVQVAVEELMACGYGVCMTCVMPLRKPAQRGSARGTSRSSRGNNRNNGEDEVVYARSCTEGPVFNGSLVLWNGATDLVAEDQAELTPAGAPSRHGSAFEEGDEHAPPGN
jgi:dihydroorotate dehydrogenase electron transfer subunit